MKVAKKAVCILLACMMFFQSVPYRAEAVESRSEQLGMEYGWIQVQQLSESKPAAYRAAIDKTDEIYIHMEDFAKIAGG